MLVRIPTEPDDTVTLAPYHDFRDPDGPKLFEPTWQETIEDGWNEA